MTCNQATHSHGTGCGSCCTRLNNVGVSFGNTTVLKDINLHIHCGQLTVIIGPNGAGKTTLFKALLGEIPYTGSIHNDLSQSKKNHPLIIGYVPQRLDFDATSPVSVMDLFSASLSKRPVWLGHNPKIILEARQSLEKVEASHLLFNRLGTLSGGQLQRVLLALALTPVPDLLLLDEPVSGVDPSGIDLFYHMVSELRRTNHMAVLLVSHDCAVAARYADRMVFLNQQILCDGHPGDVLACDVVVKTFGSIVPPDFQPKNTAEPLCCTVNTEEHS